VEKPNQTLICLYLKRRFQEPLTAQKLQLENAIEKKNPRRDIAHIFSYITDPEYVTLETKVAPLTTVGHQILVNTEKYI
jgi:hypothetical protein